MERARCPSFAAHSIGVQLSNDRASGFIPALVSIVQILSCPFAAAQCKQFMPRMSRTLMFALACLDITPTHRPSRRVQARPGATREEGGGDE